MAVNRKKIPWLPLLIGATFFAFLFQLLGFWIQLEQPFGKALYSAANLLLNSEFIKPEEMALRTSFIVVGQVLGYVAFYGLLLRIAWVVLGDNLRVFYVRWFCHSHIVVCDLNEAGKAFVRNAYKNNPMQRIVVLLDYRNDEDAFWCQRYGAILLQGDATRKDDLQMAAVSKAKAVVACRVSTDMNLQIAKAVQEISATRSCKVSPVDVYLEMGDTMLSKGLGNENYRHFLQPDEHFNPCFYNVDNLLARWYFNHYPPHTQAEQHGETQVHLVFFGFSPLVETLICQYAKISPYKHFLPPVFTLLGENAAIYKDALVSRYPVFANGRHGAEQVIAGLHSVECSSLSNLNETTLAEITAFCPVTAILFCDKEDDVNFCRAITLHEQVTQIDSWEIPFYVRLQQSEGIYALLDSANQVGKDSLLIPFGMVTQLFNIGYLEQVENNARTVHEAYRKNRLKDKPGVAVSEDSMKPWGQLAETYRAANRRAGDHLPVKLASIDVKVEPDKPLTVDAAIRFDEPTDRCELLSRLEHRSWRYERLINGWRYGEMRNNRQRLHPSLVLWADLSASEKLKDVEQLESIRQILGQSPEVETSQIQGGLQSQDKGINEVDK